MQINQRKRNSRSSQSESNQTSQPRMATIGTVSILLACSSSNVNTRLSISREDTDKSHTRTLFLNRGLVAPSWATRSSLESGKPRSEVFTSLPV